MYICFYLYIYRQLHRCHEAITWLLYINNKTVIETGFLMDRRRHTNIIVYLKNLLQQRWGLHIYHLGCPRGLSVWPPHSQVKHKTLHIGLKQVPGNTDLWLVAKDPRRIIINKARLIRVGKLRTIPVVTEIVDHGVQLLYARGGALPSQNSHFQSPPLGKWRQCEPRWDKPNAMAT